MKSRGNTGGLIVKNVTIKTSTYIFYRRVLQWQDLRYQEIYTMEKVLWRH